MERARASDESYARNRLKPIRIEVAGPQHTPFSPSNAVTAFEHRHPRQPLTMRAALCGAVQAADFANPAAI